MRFPPRSVFLLGPSILNTLLAETLSLCSSLKVRGQVSHSYSTTGRDSSVGIALGYGLNDRRSRVRFSAGAGNFPFHHRIRNGSGAHTSASYPMGTRGSFPRVKRSGREADHSLPSSAEVKECVELSWTTMLHVLCFLRLPQDF
jgi:hypothetical protein